jgi:ABC-type phosphate transport system ATPase subunit
MVKYLREKKIHTFSLIDTPFIEPTSALDPESTLMVENTLKGRTCIWITHSPQQEERVATRSLVLPRLAYSTKDEENDIDLSSATEISISF